MKKILIFITLLIILTLCVCISVNAEEVIPDAIVETEEVTEVTEEAPISAEIVKNFILSNLDKICSTIAAAGFFVLAWIYKKGLYPLISNVFTKLGNILSATKVGLTEVVDANRKDITKAVEVFDKGVEAINDMAEKFAELQKLYEAQELKNAKLETTIEKTNTINRLLCDMFKEFFINVNLPDYAKEQVYAHYAKMIACIDTSEEAVNESETNT